MSDSTGRGGAACARWWSLDGQWTVTPDPGDVGRRDRWWLGMPAGAREVRVPGVLQEAFPAYHGVAWYFREFDAPPSPGPGWRSLLRFDAVDYAARVWLNGTAIGGHEGGETPFELDATRALIPGGRNVVVVRVVNPGAEPIDGMTVKTVPHRNKAVPHYVGGSYNYGGLVESVSAAYVPAVRIADVYVAPDASAGSVQVHITVRNAARGAAPARLHVVLSPAEYGGMVAEARAAAEVPPGDTVLTLAAQIPQHRLWDLDDPVLYRASVRLSVPRRPDDERSVRFGFRDLRVVDGFFELNGRRIFLKSTHTGNHCPVGQVVPPDAQRDALRRDLVYARASGFNMVRFIAGMAHPWQLDACDELGLMVYEESLAGWCLEDSPHMAERFDRSVREMVLRDRNHPSITVWGLLNETQDGPVYRRAAASLPLVRELDDTRLVLLGSGRWDGRFGTGSVSNPGGAEWEHVWGAEGEGRDAPAVWGVGGYIVGAGDAHMYPAVPHSPETERLIRTAGHGANPVFLSEYGIGSVMNVIREARTYEQHHVPADTEDYALMRSMVEAFLADWDRFGLEGIAAFPEDVLLESQRLHSRQRTVGFDLIRSNPRLCGFNLTGMLDHGMTGEGLWTFWREWKPGTFDVVRDGWAPLRWCLFASPMHVAAGRRITLEAVLANEGVLAPGSYPCVMRVVGPHGVAWERRAPLTIGADRELAVPAFLEDAPIDGPPGLWTAAVEMERGGAPSGGRLRFHVSAEPDPIAVREIACAGIDPAAVAWLERHGVRCSPFDPAGAAPPVLLIGDVPDEEDLRTALLCAAARGSVALHLAPASLRRGEETTGWLPLRPRGWRWEFSDWLYHKECVANRHPAMAGLQGPGVMDWDYYGPVISSDILAGVPTPDETVVAAFALGHSASERGYVSGVMVGSWRFGAGSVVVSTLRILPNLGTHPAADRLLLNLLEWADAMAPGPAPSAREAAALVADALAP